MKRVSEGEKEEIAFTLIMGRLNNKRRPVQDGQMGKNEERMSGANPAMMMEIKLFVLIIIVNRFLKCIRSQWS